MSLSLYLARLPLQSISTAFSLCLVMYFTLNYFQLVWLERCTGCHSSVTNHHIMAIRAQMIINLCGNGFLLSLHYAIVVHSLHFGLSLDQCFGFYSFLNKYGWEGKLKTRVGVIACFSFLAAPTRETTGNKIPCLAMSFSQHLQWLPRTGSNVVGMSHFWTLQYISRGLGALALHAAAAPHHYLLARSQYCRRWPHGASTSSRWVFQNRSTPASTS